jgi:hypothetical protein
MGDPAVPPCLRLENRQLEPADTLVSIGLPVNAGSAARTIKAIAQTFPLQPGCKQTTRRIAIARSPERLRRELRPVWFRAFVSACAPASLSASAGLLSSVTACGGSVVGSNYPPNGGNVKEGNQRRRKMLSLRVQRGSLLAGWQTAQSPLSQEIFIGGGNVPGLPLLSSISISSFSFIPAIISHIIKLQRLLNRCEG